LLRCARNDDLKTRRGSRRTEAQHTLGRHRPPPGRRAPPDDRLRRAIQYSRDANDSIEKLQRTGYPACAGYDELLWRGAQRHP
jgi:hypothetical protein